MAESKRPDTKDDADDPWSHAREVEPTVDARVEFIEGVMTALLWERGKSAKKLAAIWDTPLSTVQNYSAEASRRVTGDADEARRDISVGARKMLREAVEAKDANGFKAVATIWAEVSGAKAPEKHQIGALESATPGKAREVMTELFGGVTPEKKPDADPER